MAINVRSLSFGSSNQNTRKVCQKTNFEYRFQYFLKIISQGVSQTVYSKFRHHSLLFSMFTLFAPKYFSQSDYVGYKYSVKNNIYLGNLVLSVRVFH